MNLRELAYEELIEFIDELRQYGYHISTEQYIAVQRLLVALAASGDSLEYPQKLGKLLAPILCTSPEEQQSFYRLFEQWLTYQPIVLSSIEKKNRPGGARLSLPDQGSKSPLSLAWLLNNFSTWLRNLRLTTITIIITVTLILIVGASVFLRFIIQRSFLDQAQITLSGRVIDDDGQPVKNARIQFSGGTTYSNDTGSFSLSISSQENPIQLIIDHPDYQVRSVTVNQTTALLPIQLSKQPAAPPKEPDARFPWWEIAFAAIGISLVIAALWLFKFRYRLQLKKWRTRSNPQIEHLMVEGAGEYLTQILSLRRTAQELRRHRQLDSDDLNLHATIDETIRRGLFTPVYSARKSLPEYLVLIDRESFNDQRARLEDEIVQRLIKNDVYISRYYFQGDPRLCRQDEPKVRYFTLQELAALYPENNLIIFSGGTGLFNPLTGRPQRWLKMFYPWINRALLTLEPYERSYQRLALSELEFLVLPASKAGMIALGELVSTGDRHGANINSCSKPLPSILQERPSRWLESYPPPLEILNELCFQLKQFLGEDGYFWLSACAVYPMLYWDLTLYFGYKLTSREKLDERLLSLVRLPWFHYGSMPDWLRRHLIFELPGSHALLIRKVLEDLLKSSLLRPEGFVLPFARGLRRAERWAESLQGVKRKLQERQKKALLRAFIETEPEDSPAREYVFLSFMSGFKQNRLAVLIPTEVRSILIRNDEGIRELHLLNISIISILIGYLTCTTYIGLSTGNIEITVIGLITTVLFAAIGYDAELQVLKWEKTGSTTYTAKSLQQESVRTFESHRFQKPPEADTTNYLKEDQRRDSKWINHLADIARPFLVKPSLFGHSHLEREDLADLEHEVETDKSNLQSSSEEDAVLLLGGRYRLIRKLSVGSLGEVCLAYDTATRKRVEVTLIKNLDDQQSQEMIASVERGVQLQKHLFTFTPHVLKVHAYGRDGDYFYAVMDYIEGKDLADMIHDGTLSYAGIIDIAMQICRFIAGSHYAGIIHGDINPRNVRVGANGRVYLLDFNNARTLSVTQYPTSNDWGTPAYFSPERLETGIVDARSDLWSVGILLYEMITGKLPFQAPSNHELERLIQAGELSAPLPRDCPESLKKIVNKGLAANINYRYMSAIEMKWALEVVKLEPAEEKNLTRLTVSKVERAYEFADLSTYPFKKRMLIRTADLIFYLLIQVIGRTARFEVEGWEHHEQVTDGGNLPIYNFWHEQLFLTTYWWRQRRIVMITSQSFDGEYISRFLQRFGYGAVRGSRTRGQVGAVVEMVRLMRAGCTTAFTIDGPKGPRRVAKMGSVLLAKKTGHPVLPVTMALRSYWPIPSWDSFQIPKPFTRAKVYIAPPIYVPADADESQLEAKRDELQQVLDEINDRGEDWRIRLG